VLGIYGFVWTDWRELTTEKLRVGQQLDEVRPISRLDVVALQVQRDVAEGCRVAVDVEGSHAAGVDRCRAGVGGGGSVSGSSVAFQLFLEELREVRWGY
jgi:hypothetical protein